MAFAATIRGRVPARYRAELITPILTRTPT
jgi:hypothetical protein